MRLERTKAAQSQQERLAAAAFVNAPPNRELYDTADQQNDP